MYLIVFAAHRVHRHVDVACETDSDVLKEEKSLAYASSDPPRHPRHGRTLRVAPRRVRLGRETLALC